ncbi:hypothetical protein [Mesorhizobium koreense]|uniref:hypothetical protein n=1 Tax=Mesorhizobium koreense TaxID=3074855 RepID=UPI00287B65A1|nr:hypothetical protein [Mesorhizobium sp. WR6]
MNRQEDFSKFLSKLNKGEQGTIYVTTQKIFAFVKKSYDIGFFYGHPSGKTVTFYYCDDKKTPPSEPMAVDDLTVDPSSDCGSDVKPPDSPIEAGAKLSIKWSYVASKAGYEVSVPGTTSPTFFVACSGVPKALIKTAATTTSQRDIAFYDQASPAIELAFRTQFPETTLRSARDLPAPSPDECSSARSFSLIPIGATEATSMSWLDTYTSSNVLGVVKSHK